MMTATKPTVKYWFAGEFTTTFSPANGLLPNRTCGHKHKSMEAADKCAAKNYPWQTYAELADGRTVTASYAFTS